MINLFVSISIISKNNSHTFVDGNHYTWIETQT